MAQISKEWTQVVAGKFTREEEAIRFMGDVMGDPAVLSVSR
jgi:hypothetical protein